VGLCVERSIEMVIGLLGILKAGGAYLPLDPSYPAERLSYMLEDAHVEVLLTQQSLVSRLPAHGGSQVLLDSEGSSIWGYQSEALPPRSAAENLAYVIYTSGSTGKPKGVSVVHRNVVRLVKETDYVRVSSEDRILQLSSSTFDAATFEIWGALLNGGLLVLPGRERVLSPREIEAALKKGQIQSVFLTTALFNHLAQEVPGVFSGIREVLFGGEAVDASVVRHVLQEGAPERLLHVYGPTECTTFSTWHWVRQLDEQSSTVPIGQPLANGSSYVLDEQQELVPVGVAGELYLGGAGVSRGYLNRAALTAERFVPDPFGGSGERLYRTGDRVRWNARGELEFLGRADHQVKIRGFRIELGEVESVLLEHPSLSEVVVVAREDVPGDKRLVAYVVGAQADASELRTYLTQRVPEYMIPAAFVVLEQLPLSAHGKVDRRRLPVPQIHLDTTTYVAPRNHVEAVLTQIWSEVLKVPQVGIHDDFFSLGGDSLLAMRMIASMRKMLGIDTPIRLLFESRTVAALAARSEEIKRSQRVEQPPLTARRRRSKSQV